LPAVQAWQAPPDTISAAPHWQVSPPKPVAHSQVKAFAASVQVPPFKHGSASHSSVSLSHWSPKNPSAQVQEAEPSPSSAHVPAFWHGFGVQGSFVPAQL